MFVAASDVIALPEATPQDRVRRLQSLQWSTVVNLLRQHEAKKRAREDTCGCGKRVHTQDC